MHVMLAVYVHKVYRSLRRHGFAETLRLAGRFARTFTPAGFRVRKARLAEDRAFDVTYGVETGGMIALEALHIPSANLLHGVRYEPINPHAFHELMRLAGNVEGRTFIDFGAGKGRAMLLAAESPLRKILGVEFAPQLVAVCRQNLSDYQNPKRRCWDIEIHEGDAAELVLPNEPLVLFFYNPFDAPVMARVVDNVRRSLEAQPRPVTVIYHTPKHETLWASLPSLVRQPSPPGTAIYYGMSL
jgi:hypothetical protein